MTTTVHAGTGGRPARPARTARTARTARSAVRKPLQFVVHRQRRVSVRFVVISSVLAFFVVLFLGVSVQQMRAQQDRSIDVLDQQIRTEAERYLELRAELAEQESPARVMDRARALGMIEPGPVAPLSAPDPSGIVSEGNDATAGP